MKYRLSRLSGPARSATRRMDAARALHAAIRQSLNQCYRMGGPRRVPVDKLIDVFMGCFDGSASADSREEEEHRTTGIRLLTEYHADHRSESPSEVAVDLRLRAEIGEYRFEARADRREVADDGHATLVIYTTARRPPSENALQSDLQTGILQMLGQQAEHAPIAVQVHALRKRGVLQATKPPDVLDDLRDRVRRLAAAISDATDYPTVRGRHCRWCHARAVCTEWTPK
jgi:RecB family exonuclease